jgi:hypothetical protein
MVIENHRSGKTAELSVSAQGIIAVTGVLNQYSIFIQNNFML